MNLFSFFKKAEKKGADTSIDSTAVTKTTAETSTEQSIETELSLAPSWNIPQEQEYVFRFLANELQPLLPNQLSLSGIEIEKEPLTNQWLVKAFFRSSLSDTIELNEVDLLLLDKDGKRVGESRFDFTELGEIPGRSARPWIFVFEPHEIFTEEEALEDGWSLAFNLATLRDHQLDLDPQWEEFLPAEQKEALAELVATLPELKKGEVNFIGFQIGFGAEGQLEAAIFIRNGHTQQMNLEELPLEIFDANQDLVVKGSFTLPPLVIEANTTKPWTFIFPKQLVTKENPDFSRWIARVPQ